MREQKLGVGRLAILSGIDQRSLVRYRSGIVVPRDSYGQPTANAWKLARALGVPLEELLPSGPDLNGDEAAA
jgi:hypothetical protein